MLLRTGVRIINLAVYRYLHGFVRVYINFDDRPAIRFFKYFFDLMQVRRDLLPAALKTVPGNFRDSGHSICGGL
jgi:hypothetical protein